MVEPTLLHKYQPKYLKEFETHPELVRLLQTFLPIHELNLLLVGNRASGKTTFLHAIIREYYQGYSPKMYEDNILHINSIKEYGIHYYRNEMKTFCKTISIIKNKKKIIVLDNLDMISDANQQVFRNYMDKYENILFIGTCTNIQKVHESIYSRLINLTVEPFTRKEIEHITHQILEKEKISMDKEAKERFMEISNNNIKMIINYIEKFKILDEHITCELVYQLCNDISFVTFEKYIQCIVKKDLAEAIQIIYSLHENGYSVVDILDHLFTFVKQTRSLEEKHKYVIISYICKYIAVFHLVHEDIIELCFFTNNLIKTLEPTS
jgi:DNA polymerase III delta prime subunit